MSRKLLLRSIGTLEIAREFRDPVYNYIHVTNFENDTIDSRVFQRLDGLSQMPTAHFVYPSGEYSRKTHSLGAMHLMSKAILHILYLHSDQLRQEISPLLFGESVVYRVDRDKGLDHLDQMNYNSWWDSKGLDEIVQYSRLAALLHDIGHAPFSHTFEDLTKELKAKGDIDEEFDHEKMSREIIIEKEGELGLGDFEGKEIVGILDKKGEAPEFLKELISGPCDCDKLDYLMRDSHHVGAPEYGSIDADRIIDGFRVKNLRLCISSSAIHAVMNSFRAVQSMYTAIYYHRASRVFDFMIADALSKVPEFIQEITSSVDEFLKYDDHSIICAIRERAQGTDFITKKYKEAKELLDKVKYREKTYKNILEFPLSFPLAVKQEAQEDIEKAVDEFRKIVEEEEITDFNFRYDYRPAIRPVGINLDEIIDWLRSPRIYDTTDNTVTKLEDKYLAYFRDLIRYSILFRIFVDRKKSEEYPHKIERIKEKVEIELDKLEEKWTKMMLP
ncbi:MAG: HD domain-containing protein [Theionarchaea archaeon]|nr:HD domain-containing protein [Theionarchaea archaeon]